MIRRYADLTGFVSAAGPTAILSHILHIKKAIPPLWGWDHFLRNAPFADTDRNSAKSLFTAAATAIPEAFNIILNIDDQILIRRITDGMIHCVVDRIAACAGGFC